jgi:hypothetical protein
MMGKRGDELRKLIKEFPPPADITAILDGMREDPDRSAALVGAAILESGLERILIHNLKVKTAELKEQLFQLRGPLGDFSSKISMAVAYGFISEAYGGELQIIRKMRNVFAHAITTVSFDTPEIVRELDRSRILSITRSTAKEIKATPRPKAEFVMLVRILFIILDHDQQKLGGLALSL